MTDERAGRGHKLTDEDSHLTQEWLGQLVSRGLWLDAAVRLAVLYLAARCSVCREVYRSFLAARGELPPSAEPPAERTSAERFH